MILALSGKPSIEPSGKENRWKYVPDLLSGHQTLMLSTATRHLSLLEWQGDSLLFPPMETALTENETRLLHVLWDAYPECVDQIDLINTLAMPREIIWRSVSTLRKKLKVFGMDMVTYKFGGYGGCRYALHPSVH